MLLGHGPLGLGAGGVLHLEDTCPELVPGALILEAALDRVEVVVLEPKQYQDHFRRLVLIKGDDVVENEAAPGVDPVQTCTGFESCICSVQV